MDWQHSKFDWNKARAFLATVDEGSLPAAARTNVIARNQRGYCSVHQAVKMQLLYLIQI